jgi:hypothetical protein
VKVNATRSVAVILARPFKAGVRFGFISARRVSDALRFARGLLAQRRYATHNLAQADFAQEAVRIADK